MLSRRRREVPVNRTYNAGGTATTGASFKFSTAVESDDLLSLDLQGSNGHDLLVAFTTLTRGAPTLLNADLSLSDFWEGGAGTITAFSLISTTADDLPSPESFTGSTSASNLTFLSPGTTLSAISPPLLTTAGGAVAALIQKIERPTSILLTAPQ